MHKVSPKTMRRVALIIIPILLVVISVCSMLFYQSKSLVDAQAEVYRSLEDSALEQTRLFQALLDGQYDLLSTFAATVSSEDAPSWSEIHARMNAMVKSSDFSCVFVIDQNGQAYTNEGQTFSVADRYYFQRSLSHGKCLQKIDQSRLDGFSRFVISVPIKQDGQVVGVCAASYNEQVFRAKLVAEVYSRRGYSFVCDSDGTILIGSDSISYLAQDKNVFSFFPNTDLSSDDVNTLRSNLLQNQSGVLSYRVGDEHRYAIYRPLGLNDWTLFSVVPGAVVDNILHQTAFNGYTLMIIITAVSLLFLGLVMVMSHSKEKRLKQETALLALSDERFRTALRSTSVVIWDYDLATHRILSSDKTDNINDNDPTLSDVPESLIAGGLICPESVDDFREMYARLFAGEREVEGVFHMQLPDGLGKHYKRIRYTNLFDADGKPYRAIGSSEDVTQEYEVKEKYEQELQWQKMLASNVYSTALLDITAEQVVHFHLSNTTQDLPVKSLTFADFFAEAAKRTCHDEDLRRFFLSCSAAALTERFRNQQHTFSFEFLCDMGDHGERWVQEDFRMTEAPDTGHLMAFVSIKDIDADKRHMDVLRRAAETDAMTGLLDHTAIMQHISRYLSVEGRGGVHALFMVDMDNFKSINDTLGHQAGDDVVCKIAHILSGCFHDTDLLGRIGGDEFLILMKNVKAFPDITKKAQQLVSALQLLYTVNDTTVALSCSLGISLYQGHQSPEQLYAAADSALYTAKRAGKKQYAIADTLGSASPQTPAMVKQADIVQLQMLLEYMDGGVVLFEIGDQITFPYISPSFYKALHHTDRIFALDGDSLWDTLYPGDKEALDAILRRAAKSGEQIDHTYRVYASDGCIGWRHLRAVRMPYDQNGHPLMIGVVSDVTQLKQSEESLNIAEETYHLAMKQTGARMWRVNLATHTFYEDEETASFFGHTESVFADAPNSLLATNVIHPDSIPEFRRMFDNLYAGNDREDYLIQSKDRNGHYIWTKSHFSLLNNTDGQPLWGIGIHELIPNIDTAMRRFDEELFFSHSLLDGLLCFIQVNLTQNQLTHVHLPELSSLVPPSYEELCNLLKHLAAGPEDAHLLSEKLAAPALIEAFRSGHEWAFADFRRVVDDGHIRWMSLSIHLIRHPITGALYAFMYGRDVDARHRWEAALPRRAERDTTTLLYTADTTKAILTYILSQSFGTAPLCALCLIEIEGLDLREDETAIGDSHFILLIIGRIFRTLCGGEALVGRMDDTHLLIFRMGITDTASEEARLDALCKRATDAILHAYPTSHVTLTGGMMLVPLGSLSEEEMLAKAACACKAAVQQRHTRLRLYSEPSAPASSADSDDEGPSAALPAPSAEAAPVWQNRQNYYDMLLHTSPDSVATLGALFADINGLSRLNHEHGMEYGDTILRNVADILSTVFAHNGDFYRLSGDDFLVLCHNLTEEKFLSLCEKAQQVLRQHYENLLNVGLTWDDHVTSIQKLVDHAEELMDVCKQNAQAIASPDTYSHQLQKWLEQSLSRQYLHIYLQPKAAVATGEIIGCEALVRYEDENSGVVPPNKFVPLLEKEHLIKQLDFFMLRSTLKLLRSWHDAGAQSLHISTNFSRQTLLDPGTFDEVKQLVREYTDVLPQLKIEITETIGSIERSTLVRLCQQYRQAGFQLSLDDFGSQYSSLSLLSAVQFDEIKIDKSVVDDIVTNQVSQLIVSGTRRIAEQTGATLLAEGVETEEQLAILNRLHCDAAQGYLFNKPLPAATFESLYVQPANT